LTAPCTCLYRAFRRPSCKSTRGRTWRASAPGSYVGWMGQVGWIRRMGLRISLLRRPCGRLRRRGLPIGRRPKAQRPREALRPRGSLQVRPHPTPCLRVSLQLRPEASH